MALIVECAQTVIGIPMADTYARISHFQGDKNYTTIFVEHHVNSNARHSNAQPIAMLSFTVPTCDCETSLSGMYNWLKQQPEYSNSEDC